MKTQEKRFTGIICLRTTKHPIEDARRGYSWVGTDKLSNLNFFISIEGEVCDHAEETGEDEVTFSGEDGGEYVMDFDRAEELLGMRYCPFNGEWGPIEPGLCSISTEITVEDKTANEIEAIAKAWLEQEGHNIESYNPHCSVGDSMIEPVYVCELSGNEQDVHLFVCDYTIRDNNAL